jgi:divalent metal cation (Fe/Co/Zn/Cd) transporter
MELSDTISKDVADKVRKEILATKAVCKCEGLKIRKVGDKAFVRVTVQVPDYLDLEEAHDLTSEIEANIKKVVGNAEVAIHTEPCETDMPTQRLVEKLATEVHGVKEAHEINTSYTDGKLYITLHVYVDPKLSVEEAHEIAEEIEDKIEGRVANLENVAVHVEPFSPKKRRGSMVDENEIIKVVYGVGRNHQRTFRIKRIVTYVADKKRYINIDCCFVKEMSIEEAHEVTSQIEETLRERFEETIVVVHMEPN